MRAAPYQALRFSTVSRGAALIAGPLSFLPSPLRGGEKKEVARPLYSRCRSRRSVREGLAGAEINFAHLGILADRGGIAVGDQPPARQHDDAVRIRENHVHRVLGKQHRDAAL